MSLQSFSKEIWFYALKYKVKAIQLIILFLVSAGLVIYTNAWMEQDGYGQSFRVAHAAAAAIMFLIPVIFLSFLKGIQEVLGTSVVGKLLVFDLFIHKVAAISMFLFSVIHGISHGFYDLSNYTNSYGYTGWTMYFCMIFFLVIALPSLRHRLSGFNSWFLRPHKIAAFVMLICYWVHYPVERTKKLWPYCIGITALFLLDRLITHAKYTHKLKLSLYKTRILDENTFVISLVKPEGMQIKQAQYAKLIYHPISNTASHPFSISSSVHSDTIDFVIRVAGGWTRRFYTLLKDQDFMKANNTLYMVGPFTEHSISDVVYENEVAFIAAGAGVTPFLNIIRSFRGHCDAVNIVGHVTSRNFADFKLVLEAAAEARERGVSSEIYVYWTGKEDNKHERIMQLSRSFGFDFEDPFPDPESATEQEDAIDTSEAANAAAELNVHAHRQRTYCFMGEHSEMVFSHDVSRDHSHHDHHDQHQHHHHPNHHLDISAISLEVHSTHDAQSILKRRAAILDHRDDRRRSHMPSLDNSVILEMFPTQPNTLTRVNKAKLLSAIVTKPQGDATTEHNDPQHEEEQVKVSSCTGGGGIVEKSCSVVTVMFRDNRMDMEEVVASVSGNLYYVGPSRLATVLNGCCVQNGRKMFYTTWG